MTRRHVDHDQRRQELRAADRVPLRRRRRRRQAGGRGPPRRRADRLRRALRGGRRRSPSTACCAAPVRLRRRRGCPRPASAPSSPTAATPTRLTGRAAPATSARWRRRSPQALGRRRRRRADRVDGRASAIRLPVERIAAAVPALVAALGDDVAAAAEAIRTTDLRTKLAFREIDIGGKPVQFAAIAKGSGMIHPQMATMLCFITTDAPVAPRGAAGGAGRRPSRRPSTPSPSTATCRPTTRVIALANGRVGRAGDRARRRRAAASCRRRWSGSAAIWRAPSPPTARGRRKLLVVDVAGRARRATMARDLARAVAGGSLVKSGIFGGDPSWGRILAALGARIGARSLAVDPARRHARHPGRRASTGTAGRWRSTKALVGAHEEGRDRGAAGPRRAARHRRARSAAT